MRPAPTGRHDADPTATGRRPDADRTATRRRPDGDPTPTRRRPGGDSTATGRRPGRRPDGGPTAVELGSADAEVLTPQATCEQDCRRVLLTLTLTDVCATDGTVRD